jgi:hypothetical protein
MRPDTHAQLRSRGKECPARAPVRVEGRRGGIDPTSPTGLVSAPAILATQGDGVLLALDARKTRRGSARRSIRRAWKPSAQKCSVLS